MNYRSECDMSSVSDVLVHRSMVLVDALYLALLLGDVSKRFEARGGMVNVTPDRAT